ncbi:MAG: ribbon-helix-helix domain-containing protein [Alphaproteobacteria bacterium]|nr:ribbon-helix-helix domain-containing protein [Alphaproteobacteria bacterium]
MSLLANRIVCIYNRKTSMRLTPMEWKAIDYICEQENIPRKDLFELIELNRSEQTNLTAAIRLFTLIYYKNALTKIYSQQTEEDTPASRIYKAIEKIV